MDDPYADDSDGDDIYSPSDNLTGQVKAAEEDGSTDGDSGYLDDVELSAAAPTETGNGASSAFSEDAQAASEVVRHTDYHASLNDCGAPPNHDTTPSSPLISSGDGLTSSLADQSFTKPPSGDLAAVDERSEIAVSTEIAPAKRKLDSCNDASDSTKRQKIDSPPKRISDLPLGVLQQVFTCDLRPADLGRCLKVSRAFNQALTIHIEGHLQSQGVRDSDLIWREARRTYAPSLPEPLEGVSETRMMRLLTSSHCEKCQNQFPFTSFRPAVWQSGPGQDCLRVIWHFKARLCGTCFEALTAKDVEVIVTADKVFLPGLPFVFRTADKHYIPPSLMPSKRGAIPSSVPLSKVYYRPSLDALRVELGKLQEGTSGQAAASSWLQQIPTSSKRQIEDALRWVAWETSLQQGTSTAQAVRDLLNPTISAVDQQHYSDMNSTYPGRQVSHPLPPRLQYPDQNGGFPNAINAHHEGQQFPYAPQHFGYGLHQPANGWYGSSDVQQIQPQPAAVPPAPGTSINQTADPRSESKQAPSPAKPQDRENFANTIKALQAARKAAIEAKCEELIPPLQPNVLQHMPAYKAALVIPRELTDHDWEMLKPRLVDQRLRAEEIEQNKINTIDSSRYVDTITQRYNRKANHGELSGADAQRDQAQKAVRRVLSKLGQRVIDEKWGGAKKLLKQDVNNFAADVLLTTLDKFRNETSVDDFDMGHMVTLETVKKLFDELVKPHTDDLARDLFLCSECEESGKYYTFDGMMQHFGAKHDSDFGQGNIVVAWHSAEWPEDPPIKAHPTMSRRIPPTYAEELSRAMAQQSVEVIPSPPAAPSPVAEPTIPSFMSYLRMSLLPARDGSSDVASTPPSYADLGASPMVSGDDSNKAVVESSKKKLPKTKGAGKPKHNHMSDNPYLKALPVAPTMTTTMEQRGEIVEIASEIWRHASGVEELPDSVRLQTIIVNTALRFGEKFEKSLTPDGFKESLNLPRLKQLRKWGGLKCALCASSEGDRAPKLSISELLLHFKQSHLDDARPGEQANWLTDMLQLPDITTLRNIPNLKGMTNEKLRYIAFALPKEVFGDAVPTVPAEVTTALDSPYRPKSPEMSGHVYDSDKSLANRIAARYGIEDLEEGEVSLPEAGEGEYDPRRPSLIQDASESKAPRVRREKREKREKPARHSEYDGIEIPDVIYQPYNPNLTKASTDDDSDDSVPSPKRRHVSARQPSPPRNSNRRGKPSSEHSKQASSVAPTPYAQSTSFGPPAQYLASSAAPPPPQAAMDLSAYFAQHAAPPPPTPTNYPSYSYGAQPAAPGAFDLSAYPQLANMIQAPQQPAYQQQPHPYLPQYFATNAPPAGQQQLGYPFQPAQHQPQYAPLPPYGTPAPPQPPQSVTIAGQPSAVQYSSALPGKKRKNRRRDGRQGRQSGGGTIDSDYY